MPRVRKSTKASKVNPSTAKTSGVGSKFQVWSGSRKQTSGGLKKQDLTKNKWGRIVSKKQQANGKEAFKNPKVKKSFEKNMFTKSHHLSHRAS